MLEQVLKEAKNKEERTLIANMEEMGYRDSYIPDRLEFYCKAFPKADNEFREKVEKDSYYFSSDTSEIIAIILKYYINDYDLIKIVRNRRSYEIRIKDVIEEFKDFNFDSEKSSNIDRWLYHLDYDLIAMANKDFSTESKFLVSRTPLEISSLRNIPSSIILHTPIHLNDCVCRTTIVADEEDSHIYVNGNCVIKGKEDMASIKITSDSVIIRGEGNLVIEKNDKQPCIGTSTHTGMSYGRWSPGALKEFGIVLSNNVSVECKTNDNFALGVYGYNYVPVISIEEGCKLIAPEMEGKRVVKAYAVAPAGSTKISGNMVYAVLKEGQSFINIYEEEDRLLVEKLVSMGVGIPSDCFIETKRLEIAVDLIDVFGDINLSVLFNPKTNFNRAVAATILRCPDIYAKEEFIYETRKMDYFAKKYGGKEDSALILNSLIKAGCDKLMEGHYSSRKRMCLEHVLYELIPAFLYDGDWFKKRIEVVTDYLAVCSGFAKEVNAEEFLKDYCF